MTQEETVRKVFSDYLLELKKTASQRKFERHKDCLELFLDYLAGYADCHDLEDFYPGHVRDFLSNWYIRKAGFSATHAMDCLRSIKQFVKWLDKERGSDLSTELKEDFQRLAKDLPAVFRIMDILGEYENAQRLLCDPTFQEFFEMAGKKATEEVTEILKVEDVKLFNPEDINYDELKEGYFRITNIEDDNVEVVPYEGGEAVSSVRFPKKALSYLKAGFVINLSIAPNRKVGGWEILEHGFVYPD